MDKCITPVVATTLTPFAYHSLMVQGGSATLPELISDRAIAFGLAAALGWMSSGTALPPKNYRKHLGVMLYRTSVFMTDSPQLLPPLKRRLNIDDEGGYQKKFDDATRKGNIKTFFQTQEVPPDQQFYGAIFGLDPFDYTGEEVIIIRIGLHRAGMVKLEPALKSLESVRLNAATAFLFDHELPVDRYCLHTLQLTSSMPLDRAFSEVALWR